MSDSLIIIPTYNEKENVEAIIKAALEQDDSFHVLIVDDNSPDGTIDIVEALQTLPGFQSRLHIEVRAGKLGLGTAYIHGFKWGLAKGYKYLFEMDADFSHNPKDLVRLKAACIQGAGVAVGSRYTEGGGVDNWPLNRRALSYGASLYVRIITGMPVKDPTAGFKCYTSEALNGFDFQSVDFKGYAFQIGMKYRAYKAGFKIVEVPIFFKDRELGESKMSMGIFKEALWGVLKMRFSKS